MTSKPPPGAALADPHPTGKELTEIAAFWLSGTGQPEFLPRHFLPVAQWGDTRYAFTIMKAVALSTILSLFAFSAASCQESSARKSSNVPKTKMKEKAVDSKGAPSAGHETITLGAGCFWCVEAVYQQLEGIHSVVSGYMGGHVDNPTYEQICQKNTGHIEVVQVVFDPEKITTASVLNWFWELHDPTSKDQQGADKGPQYRSAVFVHDAKQQAAVEKMIAKLDAAKEFKGQIVTTIEKYTKWYPAEDYHQEYFKLNPNAGYCQFVVGPKVAKFQKRYKDLLKPKKTSKP